MDEIFALTTPSFDFTRSETFTDGKGSGGSKTPILKINKHGIYGVKYNSYRFTVNDQASDFIKASFSKFERIVVNSKPFKINLNYNSTLIINNTRATHCRDIVKDNRRLLIRLFGYRDDIDYIEIQKEPLIVKG
ncbi:hypothetical protein [Bartonella rattaustraliani]|uniref:hypothetical protein n=1 Tax=Bartonella rattaustraliani TaxID=481139 RepID=UPI00192C8E4F|nr:hypothetical protein [Bartonella rattaustraliani]